MCTGRVDLSFVLRALSKGADGVFIGGCWPGECHYLTEGNYDALSNAYLVKRLLTHVGLDADRVRLEWIAASEGARYAELMDAFVQQIRELGPLGRSEGLDREDVAARLRAVDRLVPYLKLVERERMRVTDRSEAAYEAFWSSDEASRLFDELVVDKLTVSQILLLLERQPLSTAEIAESLSLNPSAVSKHMNRSSRQGLVRFDIDRNRYMLA